MKQCAQAWNSYRQTLPAGLPAAEIQGIQRGFLAGANSGVQIASGVDDVQPLIPASKVLKKRYTNLFGELDGMTKTVLRPVATATAATGNGHAKSTRRSKTAGNTS